MPTKKIGGTFRKKFATKRKVAYKRVKYAKTTRNTLQGPKYGVSAEPFPRELVTKCKFAEALNMQTNAVFNDYATFNTYRANCIWDCDLTGTGKTVVGWDALKTIYGRYIVSGCKINVKFNNPDQDGGFCGVRLRINDNNPAQGGSRQSLSEQPMTYMKAINNTGSQAKTFSLYVKPWTLIGISKLEYMANASSYSASMAGDATSIPTIYGSSAGAGCTWDIFYVNTALTGVKIDALVTVTFYTKFYNRKGLTSTS